MICRKLTEQVAKGGALHSRPSKPVISGEVVPLHAAAE
jgi:hypothetical protein